ncbi:FMN-binding protein [Roseiconus lacunae]|uniref:FMN-binding protein n=1 Tax=Roseiconus lacunae TaxID=2605694 RepID=UPI0011F2E471|nr:FMN-binding protein [Roseiconus lacunae]
MSVSKPPIRPTIQSILSSATQTIRWLCLFCFVTAAQSAWSQDSVEFLNGTTLSGKVIEIRKADKEFDFQSIIAGQSVARTYQYSKIHAVTFNGKRFVINPLPSNSGPVTTTDTAHNKAVIRSSKEVRQIIETVGSSDPDWLAGTPDNYPNTLDLTWPIKPSGPWNESKNVGQFLWGRVNPNPSRWRSGIKLIYGCIDKHTSNRELLQRDYASLADKYFVLFQDYPRAAYWFQKANVQVNQKGGIHLAECYYRLGSKPMAMALLRGKSLHVDAIKLLGEMDELDTALKIADQYGRTQAFNEAFLNAGDALRSAGRHDEAIAYYQQILDRNRARNQEYLQRYKGRARDSINAIKLFDKADVTKVADGTFTDTAVGYNGDLEVRVTVANKTIKNVEVNRHKEKQFYAALTDTPKQIIDTQGVRQIDGTSGATITSQAIVNATARALAQGAK